MCADRLDDRALNRALLTRQFLLRRTQQPAYEVIRHLYGMQAQAPLAPYPGLWARVAGFRPDELSGLLVDRSVVRIGTLRGTVHLLTADDCLTQRALLQQPIYERSVEVTAHQKKEVGLAGRKKLAAVARELIAERPRSNPELRALLSERWPACDSAVLAGAVRNLLPCVQVPPRGLWGASGQPVVTTVEAWLGRPLESQPSLDDFILRYLAAYGPASVRDAQLWCGLTKLGEVFERLRPSLRTFTADSDGVELFDLPEAPRPGADEPAPVRFLPEYDNCLRSHANRTRVVSPEAAARLKTKNDGPKPTFLVDGFVRGTWALDKPAKRKPSAGLRIETFRPLSKRDTSAVTAEARRLLAFLVPEAPSYDVEFG